MMRTPRWLPKVWLIGRAYSAALERGKNAGPHGDLSNDEFYAKVPAAMRDPAFGRALRPLAKLTDVDRISSGVVLTAHARLVEVFQELTGKDKRSLASKYLHFHYPHLFFIYDSRAADAVRMCGLPTVSIDARRGFDRTYAQFVCAALGVREFVSERFEVLLSPRQLDRLLIGSADTKAPQSAPKKSSAEPRSGAARPKR